MYSLIESNVISTNNSRTFYIYKDGIRLERRRDETYNYMVLKFFIGTLYKEISFYGTGRDLYTKEEIKEIVELIWNLREEINWPKEYKTNPESNYFNYYLNKLIKEND